MILGEHPGDLSWNDFGRTPGVHEWIVAGLGSNSTLLKVALSGCGLRDDDVSIPAQTLGYRNTTLQKLTIDNDSISSTGVGVLLETTEQNSHHITDLDLQRNPIGNEGASLLASLLEKTRCQILHASPFIIAMSVMMGLSV
jgi:Ran GTPase-activating protein (RanGAP) involved in mRNA processing and transport